MNERRSSAPGKVVIGGEYAVLYGHAAITAAVGRRARVRACATGESQVVVTTRGYAPGRRRLVLAADGNPAWLDPPPAGGLALVESCLASAGPESAAGLALELDTREFSNARGGKLGLGSSAALTVALLAALLPDADDAGLFARAQQLHGSAGGSGVDIATAVYGGILEYRRSAPAAFAPPQVVGLPDGLLLRILYSGRPASTPERIRKLARDLSAGGSRASLSALGRRADALAASWRGGDTAALLDELVAYTDALSAFDADLGLGIFDGGHDQLAALARAEGLVYKPCGAGGGDVGAVFGSDADRIDRFLSRAAAAGFEALDLELGVTGLERYG